MLVQYRCGVLASVLYPQFGLVGLGVFTFCDVQDQGTG